MKLTGHSLSPISLVSPVSLISPEIPDCAFVCPVPPRFFPCHPDKFLKFYSKSKVGGLGGVVCHGASKELAQYMCRVVLLFTVSLFKVQLHLSDDQTTKRDKACQAILLVC